LNTSFTEGIHAINGVYTPNYAPFSWDISQPFTFPYLLNNYPKLVCDIESFNAASISRSASIKVVKDIKLTIKCPATLTMNLPYELLPGQTSAGTLNVFLNQAKARVELAVFFNITFTINNSFFSGEWNIIINQTIALDASKNTLEIFGTSLDFDYSLLDPIDFDGFEIGDYLSITGGLTPNLIGEMISLEIAISLSAILSDLLPEPYGSFLDLIIEDLSLIINPILTGYMKMDILAGSQTLVNDYQFIQANTTIPINFTAPSSGSNPWTFNIVDLSYGVNFRVDWEVGLAWATIPSFFFEDQTWSLGTWPSFDIKIADGSATLNELSKYEYVPTEGKWTLMKAFGFKNISDPSPSNLPSSTTTSTTSSSTTLSTNTTTSQSPTSSAGNQPDPSLDLGSINGYGYFIPIAILMLGITIIFVSKRKYSLK
jgi:hypothetical protein